LLDLTALEAELRSVDDGTVLLFSARARTTALDSGLFTAWSCVLMARAGCRLATADSDATTTIKFRIMKAHSLFARIVNSLGYFSLCLMIEAMQVRRFAGKRAKSHPPIAAADGFQ
jgi:hypothetical protein